MKTAGQVAQTFTYPGSNSSGTLEETILADRKGVVEALEEWLTHHHYTRETKMCDLRRSSWSPGDSVPSCTCGLDAAIAEILETDNANKEST